MSESIVAAEPRVTWPSNAISEVPFRVYTDPDAIPARAGAHLQGPDLELSVPRVEIANPATTSPHGRRDRGHVARDAAGEINAFVNRCAHRGNLLCLERRGNVRRILLHLPWLDLRPRPGKLTGVAFEHGVKRQGGMPPEFRKEEHGSAATADIGIRRLRSFGTFSDAAPDLETYLGPRSTGGLLRVMNRPPVCSAAARR